MNMVFRGLEEYFLDELKSGSLKCILDFERDHREAFMVELRDRFLDLYFLGHSVEVKGTKRTGYYLSASNTFDPTLLLADKGIKINTIRNSKSAKWQIFFKDIKKGQFEQIMNAIIAKIVEHKHGKISEGVSEINHFIDNRDIGKNGILIIDRQVVYPGVRGRIDLLGLRRLKSGKFTFAIIELKNKNNPDIPKVFSQICNYIDLLAKESVYNDFAATYSRVLKQKIELRLLRKIKCDIAPFNQISKDDLEGVVVLDNYNIKSDIKGGCLLGRALDNWESYKEYNLKLFLKTNVLDNSFFIDRNKAVMTLKDYRLCNS